VKAILFAAAAALILAGTASASVIPVLLSDTPDGSDFLFSYEAQLAPDQGLTKGDQVVVIDFMGYVPGSVASSNSDWTASVSNTLPAGLLTPPAGDSASIPDLVFTYDGPDFDTTGGPFVSDTNYLGLTAVSMFGGVAGTDFSADAVKNNGDEVGTTVFDVGMVGAPAPVTEPASWAMILSGLGAIGGGLRLSRRSLATV
jgi:hypothetical protein